MADDADDVLESEEGDKGKKKKGAGALALLLPNILKFAAIGLGALIFIVTVSVITVNIVSRGGASQSVVPENSPYQGTRPRFSMFTNIGVVRTRTKDPTPYAVIVDMVIAYDENDSTAQSELIARTVELRDFVRSFFRSKYVEELEPENERQLKREIIELLNTQILNTAKVRDIFFNQLDSMEV